VTLVADESLRFLASPLGRFRPWVDPRDGVSPQREFLQAAGAPGRVRVFRAANQTGKSTIGATDALLAATGWHPFFPHRPPVRLWFSVLSWEFGVGQVIWPAMRELMPWSEVRNVLWWRRGEPEMPQAISFKNGSLLEFKTADAGRRKYQGAPLHGAYEDEEHEPDVHEEIRARLIHHHGVLALTLTPVMRMRWVMDLERARGTVVVRATSEQAIRAGILNAAAVESYSDTLSERQKAVRLRGDYAAVSGLVYPEFDRGTHVLSPSGGSLRTQAGEPRFPWPLPPEWPRYAAVDFGYSHATAVPVVCVCPFTGARIVERLYYAESVRGSTWAGILKAALPPLRRPLVADHDAFERAELAAAGVPTRAAMKDVVPGLEVVERALHVRADGRPRLYLVVHDRDAPTHPVVGRCDAKVLAWELEGYRYPEPKHEGIASPKDLPIKRDDHACDALRYLLVDLDGAAGEGGSLAAARDLRHTPMPSVAPGLLSSGSPDPIYSDPFGPRR